MKNELSRIKWVKSEIKKIENLLNENNIKFKKIIFKSKIKNKCFNSFVELDKRTLENKRICLGLPTHSSHMWHLFSYYIIPTYKPTEAIKRYDELEKRESYIIVNIDGISDVIFKVLNTNNLTSDLCKYLLDVVVVDSKFNWIFARTHEEYKEKNKYYFGPYFFEKK